MDNIVWKTLKLFVLLSFIYGYDANGLASTEKNIHVNSSEDPFVVHDRAMRKAIELNDIAKVEALLKTPYILLDEKFTYSYGGYLRRTMPQVRGGDLRIYKILVEAGANLNLYDRPEMWKLYSEDECSLLIYMINNGLNVNADNLGQPLLNVTIENMGGEFSLTDAKCVFDVLIGNGIDINALDNTKLTVQEMMLKLYVFSDSGKHHMADIHEMVTKYWRVLFEKNHIRKSKKNSHDLFLADYPYLNVNGSTCWHIDRMITHKGKKIRNVERFKDYQLVESLRRNLIDKLKKDNYKFSELDPQKIYDC